MLTSAHRHLLAIVAILTCLMIPGPALSADKPPAKYNPIKVAARVMGTPGTVAWSPDGNRLAYIAGKVSIYDTRTKRRSPLKISSPYFVNWRDDEQLLVLHGGGELAIVNTTTGDSDHIEVPQGTIGVYPSWDNSRLIVLAESSNEIKIGMDIHHALYVLDIAGRKADEIYATRRIIHRNYANPEYVKGWLSAGPAPLTEEALMVEFIVPPNAPPYIRALTVDPFTGASREFISRFRGDLLRSWGDWSPLGRSVAVKDENDHLRILSLGGQISQVDDDISGLYPSYDPRGGRIFFGGYLIEEDGSGRVPVLPGAPDSAAFFSPDGNSLAVASRGKLWLLSGIEPAPSAVEISSDEIRDKVATLRELYSGGFITADEYRERLYAIIERQAEGK